VKGESGAEADQAPNEFGVELHESELGWEVRIVAPGGGVGWTQSCGNVTEARTLASTIRQHIYWLSPGKFREYYKIAGSE
jgi:hypothetical protein